MRKTWSLLAVPAVALLVACSTGSSQSTAKPAVTVAPGQTITITDRLGVKTVIAFTISDVKVNVVSQSGFDKPRNGQYITANALVVVQEGQTTVSSGRFKFVAADGTEYSPTLISGQKDLIGFNLKSGQKADGQLAFDVAAGAQNGGRIALIAYGPTADAGYWVLPSA